MNKQKKEEKNIIKKNELETSTKFTGRKYHEIDGHKYYNILYIGMQFEDYVHHNQDILVFDYYTNEFYTYSSIQEMIEECNLGNDIRAKFLEDTEEYQDIVVLYEGETKNRPSETGVVLFGAGLFKFEQIPYRIY
jgi:hypothetical protein